MEVNAVDSAGSALPAACHCAVCGASSMEMRDKDILFILILPFHRILVVCYFLSLVTPVIPISSRHNGRRIASSGTGVVL